MGSEEVPVLELRIHTEVVNQVSQGPQLVACLVGHRIHTQVIVLTFAMAVRILAFAVAIRSLAFAVAVRILTFAVAVHNLAFAEAVRILTFAVAVRNLAQATHQAEAFHNRPCHLEAYHLGALQLVVNLLQLK